MRLFCICVVIFAGVNGCYEVVACAQVVPNWWDGTIWVDRWGQEPPTSELLYGVAITRALVRVCATPSQPMLTRVSS